MKILNPPKAIMMLIALFFCATLALAQKTVTGNVSDSTGQPMSGVSVVVKGTKRGTNTDQLGNFSISADAGATLVFSFIGYTTKEVRADDPAGLKVQMAISYDKTTEVVVTALGIKKEKKALGYAVQEVKGSDMVKAREPNVINALAGRVAGLSINTSTNLFADPKIKLRGGGTVIVIDGVVVNSDSWNLSADDIESFSVLKGPAASALYGGLATNGAVQITTKRGTKNKKRGYSVDFNSSNQFDLGFVSIPGFQTEYGPGSTFEYEFEDGRGGGINDYDYYIWGPRFEGQLLKQWNSERDPATGELIPLPWLARGKDNLKNFMQTGILTVNNIAVSSSTERADLRFSVSQTYQKGMIPNTKLNATNINFSSGLNLSKKLRFESNINYNRQYTPNFPRVEYQPASPIYSMMVWGAANYDVRDLRDYWLPGLEGIQQKHVEYYQYSNPYFVSYENLQGYYKDDIYGYAKLKYNITPDLDIYVRTYISGYFLNRDWKYPKSITIYNGDGNYALRGGYRERYENQFTSNTDFLATYTKKLTADISLKTSLGGNLYYFNNKYLYSHTNNGILIPQLFTVDNSVDPPSTESRKYQRQILSAYAYADLDYKKMIFLNLTDRMDQSSNLPKKNNTYHYPSVSLSAVVSDMVKLPSSVSFFKLRGSYANVARDAFDNNNLASIYQLFTPYYSGGMWDGKQSLYYDGKLYNQSLKPDRTSAVEFGAELRLFKNRIGFDVAWFNYKDGPKIFDLALSPSTGGTSTQRNGLTYTRKGLEVSLNATPVKGKNFTWDFVVNWSKYRRRLLKVYDTLTQEPKTLVHIGDRTDILEYTDFDRTPDGLIIFNASNGRPVMRPRSSNNGYRGNNWTGSIQNTFRYKEFSLSFLVDARWGGKLINYLSQKQYEGGAHPLSATIWRYQDWQNRNTPDYKGSFIAPGVNVIDGSGEVTYDADGNVVSDTRKFQINETPILWETYGQRFLGRAAANVVDRSFVKLREIIFSYSIPSKLISRQKIFSAASISVVGRNLWYWTKDKAAKNMDLDQFNEDNTSSDLQSPSVRSVGVNLNLSF